MQHLLQQFDDAHHGQWRLIAGFQYHRVADRQYELAAS